MPFLVTTQRIVLGVDIHDDLRRRCVMDIDQDIDEEANHHVNVVGGKSMSRYLEDSSARPRSRRFKLLLPANGEP